MVCCDVFVAQQYPVACGMHRNNFYMYNDVEDNLVVTYKMKCVGHHYDDTMELLYLKCYSGREATLAEVVTFLLKQCEYINSILLPRITSFESSSTSSSP